MFSLLINETENDRFNLNKILNNLAEQKQRLLEDRIEIEPHLYDAYLNEREINHKKVPHTSKFSQNTLYTGTYHLKNIDQNYRRSYERSTEKDIFEKQKVSDYLNNELSKISM
jgi:hypothetical protein